MSDQTALQDMNVFTIIMKNVVVLVMYFPL